MKLKATLIIFYAAVALAGVTDQSPSEPEPDVHILEKRKGCSGNRLNNEVCQGGFIARMNSYHNCFRAGGHCCARNKNRDYGITVSNSMQSREDCGYCFSGNCKAERGS
ncbi:hypothetical protein MMC22_009655 [Lobaria immixta]|nr:hypothetical protein [Lobaria immixta]